MKAYLPLVAEFHFSEPTVKQLAHEHHVEYVKGNKIVSVMYEPGHLPLVELFSPARSPEHRRIPVLPTPQIESLANFNNMYHKLCQTKKFKEVDALMIRAVGLEPAMFEFMTAQFAELKKHESAFLA